jgi:uncharacterized protein (TIGR02145 family)
MGQTSQQHAVRPDSVFYFKDDRDNKTYKAFVIGNTTWLAEPLRHKTSNSRCYSGIPKSCKIYGRLYTWNDAITACPKGWRLPDTTQWNRLINTFGGAPNAGLFFARNDSMGFSLAFGYPPNIYGRFADEASEMHFWASDENGDNTVWHYYVIKDKLPSINSSYLSKNYSLNCLCVKEEKETSATK